MRLAMTVRMRRQPTTTKATPMTQRNGPAESRPGPAHHHHEPSRPAQRAQSRHDARAGRGGAARGRGSRGSRRAAQGRRRHLLCRRRRQVDGGGARADVVRGQAWPICAAAWKSRASCTRCRSPWWRSSTARPPAPGFRSRWPATSASPATSCKITTAFAKVGFSGDYGGTYFLTQLLGSAKARELYLMSPVLTAQEALASRHGDQGRARRRGRGGGA